MVLSLYLAIPAPGPPGGCRAFPSHPLRVRLTPDRSGSGGAVKSHTEYLTMNVPGKMAFVNITPQVEAAVRKSGVAEGLVLCNHQHAALRRTPAYPGGSSPSPRRPCGRTRRKGTRPPGVG